MGILVAAHARFKTGLNHRSLGPGQTERRRQRRQAFSRQRGSATTANLTVDGRRQLAGFDSEVIKTGTRDWGLGISTQQRRCHAGANSEQHSQQRQHRAERPSKLL